jgi:hypothetical protein
MVHRLPSACGGLETRCWHLSHWAKFEWGVKEWHRISKDGIRGFNKTQENRGHAADMRWSEQFILPVMGMGM